MKRRNLLPLIVMALAAGILAGILTAMLTGWVDARQEPQAGAVEPVQATSTTLIPALKRVAAGLATAEKAKLSHPAAAAATVPLPVPAPPIVTAPLAEATPWEPDETDVAYIAKTIYGEAGVVPSEARQAAVGWCILNRMDSPRFPDTVAEVVTAPYQFIGYSETAEPPAHYFDLARDILTRYHREQLGETDVGRTLPPGWYFFLGDGEENDFYEEWQGDTAWDWSLPDPYEEE